MMPTAELNAVADQEFLRYFRCPEEFAEFSVAREAKSGAAGYFRYGELVCYGRAAGVAQEGPELRDVATLRDVAAWRGDEPLPAGELPVLPFDPAEVATNLRYERYVREQRPSLSKRAIRAAYYLARPLLTVGVRRHLQRRWLRGWETQPFPRWPVDTTVDQLFGRLMRMRLKCSAETQIPFIWFWPEGRESSAIMTHDVETAQGLDFTGELMNINDAYGIKSSFQLIPDARYTVTDATIRSLRERGFEVNVHDLKHDGHLYDDREHFRASAERINAFGQRFESKGFRSGALYRNQEWYGDLHFSYEMSVPNCAHLDPQRGGCCTVMPYFVGNVLELPVTATQDYSLFHVIGSYSAKLWREQIGLIRAQHGMASFIVHPDYLDSDRAKQAYRELLGYLSELRDTAQMWIALPGEVDRWWRQRDAMLLVRGAGDRWRIVGEGAERARVAYARLDGEELRYSIS